MNIKKSITHDIAECLALYGDQPEELMNKLEMLVLEWYTKGQTGLNITSRRLSAHEQSKTHNNGIV